MKVTRHGHAAVLVEVSDQRILIDPGTFSADAAFALSGLSAIVVTHQHPDHLDVERLPALLEANPEATLLADPQTAVRFDVGAWLENSADKQTIVGDVTIRGVGAVHAEIAPEIPRVANVGVLVSAPGEPTLFHPGDTYEYAPEDVDVLALPLSAPWTKVSETIAFVQRVSPRSLFPIHDCTVSEQGYAIYWNHTCTYGGVADSRKLGQADSSTFDT